MGFLFCCVFLFSFLGGTSCAWSQAQHPEVVRTQGFESYKKNRKNADAEREKSRVFHDEQMEAEREIYEKSLAEYRLQKRKTKPLEETPAYQELQAERRENVRKSQKDIEEFREDKKVERKQLEQVHINKMEELGLPEDRPRYDWKKRALYGAANRFGKAPQSSGGSSGGGSGFGGGGFSPPPMPDSNQFQPPPPPSFDDFPPPPTFPMDGPDNFDLPPPVFNDGGDMGGGMPMPFDDFPPPPPPPLPPDDFQF